MRVVLYTLLLFSFSLSAVGYARPVQELDALALSGDYDELLKTARDDFSNTYRKSSLYYVALGLMQTGQREQAAQCMDLYLELALDEEVSLAAKQLVILLGNETGRQALVVEMAKELEETGSLEENLAQQYYKALLGLGNQTEANRIFSTYLKETMDAVSYAMLLLDGDASESLLKTSFSVLDDNQAITLLLKESEKDLKQEKALLLFSLAVGYESRTLDEALRRKLYTALSAFSNMAGYRVQANKYTTLANTL